MINIHVFLISTQVAMGLMFKMAKQLAKEPAMLKTLMQEILVFDSE